MVYSLLHLHSLDTITLQQGVDGRLSSAELTIEVGGRLGAPSLKDMLAEEVGCFLVEDRAVLLLCGFEDGESVSVQQFRPLIGVVACCVAAGEDMREGGRTVGAGVVSKIIK